MANIHVILAEFVKQLQFIHCNCHVHWEMMLLITILGWYIMRMKWPPDSSIMHWQLVSPSKYKLQPLWRFACDVWVWERQLDQLVFVRQCQDMKHTSSKIMNCSSYSSHEKVSPFHCNLVLVLIIVVTVFFPCNMKKECLSISKICDIKINRMPNLHSKHLLNIVTWSYLLQIIYA